MVHEVALAEPVLDEAVGGAGIGHPQQRLREHHQGQALFGRQREFAQHVLDAAERIVIAPDRLDQPCGGAVDPFVLRGAQSGRLQQPGRDDAIIRRIGRLEGRWR